MIKYEKNRFGMEKPFSIHRNKKNIQFEAHLHRCFEFTYVEDGELTVEIEGKSETISKGFGALILPNQLHSYKTNSYSLISVTIFSPEMVGQFTKYLENNKPLGNIFEAQDLEIISENDINNTFIIKSYLYKICGLFTEKVPFIDSREKKHIKNLMHDMLTFIDENYKDDCSLKTLAKKIGYDYAYLSKFFIKSIGINFSEYVNQYRIDYACYLLKNTNDTITEISHSCGFGTIRSFNRNFIRICGITPKLYRKG
ncbi:MAG: HTH-type transcriptional regulator YesS [Firmicutes bacterium ADurb.Bin193]|nr:MAG: HTH-type transcriptional regulator YesS [Firmicutes bacterium ADurb.Bin193]